jgi:hypothetical protein
MAEIKLLGLQYGPSLGEQMARGTSTRATEQAIQIRDREQRQLDIDRQRQDATRQAVGGAYINGQLNYPQAIQETSKINPDVAMQLEAKARELKLNETKSRYDRLAMFGRMVGQAKNQEQYSQVLDLAGKMGLSEGITPPEQYGPEVAEFWGAIGAAADDDLKRANQSVYELRTEFNKQRLPAVLDDIDKRVESGELEAGDAYKLIRAVTVNPFGAEQYAKDYQALLAEKERIAGTTKEKAQQTSVSEFAKIPAAVEKVKQVRQAEAKAEVDTMQNKPMAPGIAKELAKTGFIVENFSTLLDGFDNSDYWSSSIVGWVKSPAFDQALEIVKEHYSREQSGAAINPKELLKFKKQVLDSKKMFTPEGRAVAKANIEGFTKRYLLNGQYLTADPEWYNKYKQTGSNMMERFNAGRGVEDKFTIEEVK